MKKAEMYCWASNNGQYLFNRNSIEDELLKEFRDCSDYFKSDEWFILLENLLKTEKDQHPNYHPNAVFDKLFREKIILDYEFAEKLSLFDILDSECFTPDGRLGDGILQLCGMADLRFIVARKYYKGKEIIQIEFEVCHTDYERDCHKALITQTID